MLQRKTVNLLKQAGEMGKLERESVLDNDVKARLRWVEWGAIEDVLRVHGVDNRAWYGTLCIY